MWKSVSLLLASALCANAFIAQPSPSRSLIQESRSRLFVSQPLPPDDSTPASVFGRPLDDDLKETNKKIVLFIKKTIFDVLFHEQTVERSFQRFWALEEIARQPYFAYLFALHFYETVGFWRKSEYLRVHFAETSNEQQ